MYSILILAVPLEKENNKRHPLMTSSEGLIFKALKQEPLAKIYAQLHA